MRALPGVLMVFHLTGVTDYLVWVAATDAQDLREFVVDHLATHPSVAHAETSLIYEHRAAPAYGVRRRRRSGRSHAVAQRAACWGADLHRAGPAVDLRRDLAASWRGIGGGVYTVPR